MSISGLAFLIAATSYGGELVEGFPAPHIKLATGYDIVDRRLAPEAPDHLYLAGERVVAWSEIAGVPSGFIEHVWTRDGIEVSRQVLPVGAGRRWRSWSHHTVKPGSYEVRVIGPDGTVLATTRFEVAELQEDC